MNIWKRLFGGGENKPQPTPPQGQPQYTSTDPPTPEGSVPPHSQPVKSSIAESREMSRDVTASNLLKACSQALRDETSMAWAAAERMLKSDPGSPALVAAICAQDEHGETPLHLAARRVKAAKVVTLLLERGADPNAKDAQGNTPLHMAVRSLNVPATELLLARGADVNIAQRRGHTPVHWATASDRNIMVLLLAHGADLTTRDEFGLTPLDVAADDGKDEMVELLLAHGAEVNDSRFTPLHHAAGHPSPDVHSGVDRCKHEGRMKVIGRLLAHGANVNALSHIGTTPLHRALDSGNAPVVKLLLLHGASVDFKDDNGQPLSERVKAFLARWG